MSRECERKKRRKERTSQMYTDQRNWVQREKTPRNEVAAATLAPNY